MAQTVEIAARTDMRIVAEKSLDFLEAAFDEHGRNRRAPDDPCVHFKMPYVFCYGGRRDLAHRVLEHIERNLLEADGSFRDPAANGPQSLYLYQAGWLAWGSAFLGRFDLARRFARRAIAEQDDRWGGFWNENELGRVQWLLSSSSAAAGCAVAGELAAAEEYARFMTRLIERQPEPATGFYFFLSPEGEVVTAMPADATLGFYDLSGRVRPAMFATVIAGLVWLGRQTGDGRHFDTARRYADIMLAAPEPQRSAFASKSGWAALMLHAHRPDPDLAAFATGMAAAIADRQLSDGSISHADWPGFETEVPADVREGSTCDWTLTAVALANGAA